MMFDYWQQQAEKPLFPDILWSRPQQRSMAGRLAIIGGHGGGFAAVAHAYGVATEAGIGTVRAILPDSVKRQVNANVNTYVVQSNTSGGFSRDAFNDFRAACSWADVCLLIGDNGRNPETAMVFERLLGDSNKQLVITRDSVDLLRLVSSAVCERPNTTLIVSFAQLQKLFRAIYFPKLLVFSMQLAQLVETLHKFTMSYPTAVVTYHQNYLVIAHDGRVVTSQLAEPMMIWRGTIAARAATYLCWTPHKPLESITTSLIK
jgi:NAD(P)H-hydrate repair Nnr-like enzyme with NAD(P)H-hydrate dehydratase domain